MSQCCEVAGASLTLFQRGPTSLGASVAGFQVLENAQLCSKRYSLSSFKQQALRRFAVMGSGLPGSVLKFECICMYVHVPLNTSLRLYV